MFRTSKCEISPKHNARNTEVFVYLRRSAGKSLARPTSRCRRTESIVSLERGACSCAELQVYL